MRCDEIYCLSSVMKALQSFKTMISKKERKVIAMSSNGKSVKNLVLSSFFLALALVLPFLTGQIPQIGSAMCPMHIPVLLCGFFCGTWPALIVGLTAPLLRFLLFGMPVLVPTGISMCLELAAYGVIAAVLYQVLPKRKPYVYISLIGAMIAGRAVWGIVRVLFYGLGKYEFGWAMFWAGAFVNAIPGIVAQIILIPILVITMERFTVKTANV